MQNIYEGPMYNNTVKLLADVGSRVNIDRNILERLKIPRRAVCVAVPVRMDDYNIRVFQGFRVQHSMTLGPGKGGIRYHPDVTLSEVAALSMLMSFKNSLLNLPLGGAKGGVAVNPLQLSRTEKQNLTRRYTSEISNIIGPDKDIPAPDVGTDAQTMAWIMDTFSQEYGFAVPGVVTGKPLEIGGSLGRERSTGLGVIYCLEEAIKKLHITKTPFTIAVQGFGNVGSNAAFFAHERGMKIVAVSDVDGGIYSSAGLDIPALMAYYKEKKTLVGFQGADKISNEELLLLKVDALIPAALENAINSKNADKVQAAMIVEGANGPLTSDGHKILLEKGVHIIPDILANGGGVIVSYFEWVQDIASYFWSEDEVNQRLKTVITTAFHKVWDYSEANKFDMRTAALGVSLKRIEKAMLLRGLYPR